MFCLRNIHHGESSLNLTQSTNAPCFVSFHPESRGIPPETAERLVVLGFFDEVLSQLPVGSLAAELRAQVAAKLDRRTR